LALVHDTSTLEAHGFIDAPIGRHEGSIINRCVSEDGKPSLTEYWKKETLVGAELVEILLHTGRTHQIRVHLAYKGNPIIGDKLYSNDGHKYEKMYLGALKVIFNHPVTNKKIEVNYEELDNYIPIISGRYYSYIYISKETNRIVQFYSYSDLSDESKGVYWKWVKLAENFDEFIEKLYVDPKDNKEMSKEEKEQLTKFVDGLLEQLDEER